MTDTAIGANLNQSLDVEGHAAALIALHLVVFVNILTEFGGILFGQVLDADVRVDSSGLQDVLRRLSTCLLYTSPESRDPPGRGAG